MKGHWIFQVFCCFAVAACAQWNKDAEESIRNGAEAKYVYRVVDDEGAPVSNATAHVCFTSYGRPQDNANWEVQTDTNGIFSVRHVFNERFCLEIQKEGYYRTKEEIFYLGMKELPVKDGKWLPYGEERTIVLNKIHKVGSNCFPSTYA